MKDQLKQVNHQLADPYDEPAEPKPAATVLLVRDVDSSGIEVFLIERAAKIWEVPADEVEYENGLSNGMEKRFYKDGTLMQKGEFKNGQEIGIWEMYHPNGQLKQQTNFVKNLTHRGGLRCEILSSGLITVNDGIELIN